MPLVEPEELSGQVLGQRKPFPLAIPSGEDALKQEFRDQYSTSDIFTLSFGRENPFVSWLTSGTNKITESLTKLDTSYAPDLEGYEDRWEDFLYVANEEEEARVKRQIDFEKTQIKAQTLGGAAGIAGSIAGGVASPTMLVPVYGAMGAAAKAARGMDKARAALLMGGSTAAVAAGFTALDEAMLHSTQRLRTLEESAMAVGFSSALGMLLGGAGGVVLGKALKDEGALKSGIDITPENLATLQSHPPLTSDDVAPSVGAASAQNLTVEDMTPSSTLGLGELVNKLPAFGKRGGTTIDLFNSPLMRILYNSSSRAAKLGTLTLTESPAYMKGNEAGKVMPSNASRQINRDAGTLMRPSVDKVKKGYSDYRQRIKKKGGKPIGIIEYEKKLALALDRGDVSDIPEVAETAKFLRENFFDPSLEIIKQIKDLPEDYRGPKDSESYFPHVYKKNAIKARRSEYLDIMEEWVRREVGRAIDEGAEAEDLAKVKSAEASTVRADMAAASKKITNSMKGIYKEKIDQVKNDLDTYTDLTSKKPKPKKKPSKEDGASDKDERKTIEDDFKIVESVVTEEVGAITNRLVKAAEGDVVEEIADEIARISLGSLDLKSLVEEVSRIRALKEKSGSASKTQSAIAKLRAEARKSIRATIKRSLADTEAKLKKIEDDLAKLRKTAAKGRRADNIQPAEFRSIAARIAGRITDSDIYSTPFVSLTDELKAASFGTASASFLKARKLKLDDDIVERLIDEGFLVSDVTRILRMYQNSALRDIRIAQSIGDLDGAKVMQMIDEDYDILVNREPSQKKKKSLEKQREADKRDFQGMVQRMRGVYDPNPSQIGETLRDVNTMRLMGSMVESAIPDVSRVALAASSLPALKDTAAQIKNFKKFEGLRSELHNINIAADHLVQGRAYNIADVASDMADDMAENITGAARREVDRFFTLIGANHWNAFWESVVGVTTAGNIYRDINKAVSGNKSAIAKLARGNISKEHIKIIKEQMDAHAKIVDGSVAEIGFAKWDMTNEDVVAARKAFEDAIAKEVEVLIVNPGQDKPLWSSRGLGKYILQFKSFGYAAMSRVTLNYLQRAKLDPNKLGLGLALVSQISLGMLVAKMRADLMAAARGEDAKTDNWSTQRWVFEGVDRSGLAGNLTDLYNVAIQPTLQMAQVPGVEPLTRYQSRNIVDRALGPFFGLIQDVVSGPVTLAAQALSPGADITQGAIGATRRVLPYQNYLGLKYLITGGQHDMYEKFDIPK